MRSTTLVLLSAFLAGAVIRAEAAPTASTTTPPTTETNRTAGTAQAAPAEHLDPAVFRCGPILVKDQATRTRIEHLYREQFDLRQSTQAQLRDLASRMQMERDADLRETLSRQGSQLKQDVAVRDMELGLEIAQLNGDAPRAAEYESALDHVRHPEKYMPALRSPQEVEAMRAHERASAR
ncbi:MAG: hypothetical protein U0167_06940 [bacterium]